MKMGGAVVVRFKIAARIPCPHFQLYRNYSFSFMAARNITLNKALELFAAVIRMLKARSSNAAREIGVLAFCV
jgi:hypothetical protein